MAFKVLLGPKMSIRIRAKSQWTPSPLFRWVVVSSSKSGVSLLGFKFQFYPLVAVWARENNWTSLSVHFLICIVGKWILPTCISQDMLGNAAVTSDPKSDHSLTTKHYLLLSLHVLPARQGVLLTFILTSWPGWWSFSLEHSQPPDRGERLWNKSCTSLNTLTWKRNTALMLTFHWPKYITWPHLSSSIWECIILPWEGGSEAGEWRIGWGHM